MCCSVGDSEVYKYKRREEIWILVDAPLCHF